MGAIKDIVDLVTRLSNKVTDRRFAAELRQIQSMIGDLQAEQASLHEQRINLMSENAKLKVSISTLQQENASLKQQISDLKSSHSNEDQEIQDEGKDILLFITKHDEPLVGEIAHGTSIELSRVKYWLGFLEEKEMIGSPFIIGEETGYYITQKGRQFLFVNKLI